ncbi:VacJ family lipoprotein [uncultured Erythrobacter sp.]|uniref:MlaA family lipoprotein n=1 Tax=uncultured Erythrobacter sp. TaxID=263913 RepID=UPI0026042F15|nr:VacJ family lipoprotein [uncultured Erythrobacter sp.]
MPSASFLMMASPLLVGPAPVNVALEVSAAAPVEAVTARVEQLPWETQASDILQLDWSLTPAQENEGPPGEGDTQPDGSEIVVEGDMGPVERDPMAAVNETSFRITQEVDQLLVEPLADGYRDGLPGPLRDGLGNVVRNLREPANFLNFLLQGKIGKAAETLVRFTINSTFGLGGLIDLAEKPGIGLPYRRNGFGNTLGFYGVGGGPYLYVPIAGATNVRDLIGNTLDQALLPVVVGSPFDTPEYGIPLFVVTNLDSRVALDEEIERLNDTVDPYGARRDIYLYRRARDIALLKGEEPPEPPAILREIEMGLDAIEAEADAEIDGQSEPSVQPSDAPPIAGESDDEQAPPPVAVLITQPRTR